MIKTTYICDKCGDETKLLWIMTIQPFFWSTGASEMNWEIILAYLILGVFFVFVLAPIIALTSDERNEDYLTLVKVGMVLLIGAVVLLGLIGAACLAVAWAIDTVF